MRHIPFLNLPALFHRHREEFLSAMLSVVEEAHFIGGKELEAFEANFARWLDPSLKAVGCANGTDAIHLAAKAFRLEPGAEALVPAMTFVATVEGLLSAGLRVRLVDVDPATWLMTPEAVESRISSQSRLIVPVHLYGQMAVMDSLCAIAERHQCLVLEDAAQAHGAKWQGRSAGMWGKAATFSFFPGKNLGAFGDAGGIVSRDATFIDEVSRLAKHGGKKKYEHLIVGQNSRLDNLQAAVLNIKLKYIDQWNQARAQVARWYKDALSGISDLQLPVEAPGAVHAWHLYVVLVPDRDSFRSFLQEKGIETGIHYPLAIHQLPAFRDQGFSKERFPNAERVAAHGVSLPMCPTLTQSDVGYVVQTIKEYFRR